MVGDDLAADYIIPSPFDRCGRAGRRRGGGVDRTRAGPRAPGLARLTRVRVRGRDARGRPARGPARRRRSGSPATSDPLTDRRSARSLSAAALPRRDERVADLAQQHDLVRVGLGFDRLPVRGSCAASVVGLDDEEQRERDEQEVDDRGQDRPDRPGARPGRRRRTRRSASKFGCPTSSAMQRHQQPLDDGVDDRGEGGAEHDRDREVDRRCRG